MNPIIVYLSVTLVRSIESAVYPKEDDGWGFHLYLF